MHTIDNRVQYNKNERRPYVGVVLNVNGHRYFVPMESPKPNHKKMRNAIHIMRLDGGKYGLLGFNNMIPAQEQNLIEFDILKEPDKAYRELLINQLNFINDHRAEIYQHAAKTYEAVTVKKSAFHTRVCCDFKKLEQEYTKYKFKTKIQ